MLQSDGHENGWLDHIPATEPVCRDATNKQTTLWTGGSGSADCHQIFWEGLERQLKQTPQMDGELRNKMTACSLVEPFGPDGAKVLTLTVCNHENSKFHARAE